MGTGRFPTLVRENTLLLSATQAGVHKHIRHGLTSRALCVRRLGLDPFPDGCPGCPVTPSESRWTDCPTAVACLPAGTSASAFLLPPLTCGSTHSTAVGALTGLVMYEHSPHRSAPLLLVAVRGYPRSIVPPPVHHPRALSPQPSPVEGEQGNFHWCSHSKYRTMVASFLRRDTVVMRVTIMPETGDGGYGVIPYYSRWKHPRKRVQYGSSRGRMPGCVCRWVSLRRPSRA